MSPDPFIPFNLKRNEFQEWIANPQHWNKYAYALNNPLRFTDPSGMTETIYYFLNKNLTLEQRTFVEDHEKEIFAAIAAKLKEAGIKDVVFKDGSSLSDSQVQQIFSPGVKGVAFLNFANTSYAGWTPDSGTMGFTMINQKRSAILMANVASDNPDTSSLISHLGEVGAHELGHAMGFYSRGAMTSYLMFWNRDLMNEGTAGTGWSSRHFDMSIPQNRQAVDEINRTPEYQPK